MTQTKQVRPKNPVPLQWGGYYHIYNRGVNRENIFIEERNYAYFLALYARYILPIADTYAYCLLRNHFHFLVRLKDFKEVEGQKEPSQYFSNLFNAYAKTINLTYDRTGSLFQRPFGRVRVDSDVYFIKLIPYIHQNPQRHGFVDDYRDWPYSSYRALIGSSETKVDRETVLGWFGGLDEFKTSHLREGIISDVSHLIADDE